MSQQFTAPPTGTVPYTHDHTVRSWRQFMLSIDSNLTHGFGVLICVVPAIALILIGYVDVFSGTGSALITAPGHGTLSWAHSVIIPVALLGYAAAKVYFSISWMRWTHYPFAVFSLVLLFAASMSCGDTSAAGQVFFFAPAVYTAYAYRRLTAAVTIILAIALDAILLGYHLPAPEAALQVSTFAVMLIMLALPLNAATNRYHIMRGELQRRVDIDDLTGVLSRRRFEEIVENTILHEDSHLGHSLLMVDFDDFKFINDTYGHPAGDDVLTQVAKHCSLHSPPGAHIGRLGGDEMCMLWTHISPEDALRRIVALQDDLDSRGVTVGSQHIWAAVSVGVAHFPGDARTIDDLYAHADAVLLANKARRKAGRQGPPSAPRQQQVADRLP